jgi:tryptophan-rich sensory protein
MASQRWLVLLLFIAVTFAAAGIGGAATASSVNTWYPTLVKPSWNPPSWIFGPVWSSLYLLMAVAAWRVWRHTEHPGRRAALAWYFGQLVLNALWSCLFFGLRNPGLAFAEVIVLWASLVVVLLKFARIDRPASLLWLPYLAWVSFATVLNGTVWWLNR